MAPWRDIGDHADDRAVGLLSPIHAVHPEVPPDGILAGPLTLGQSLGDDHHARCTRPVPVVERPTREQGNAHRLEVVGAGGAVDGVPGEGSPRQRRLPLHLDGAAGLVPLEGEAVGHTGGHDPRRIRQRREEPVMKGDRLLHIRIGGVRQVEEGGEDALGPKSWVDPGNG